MRHSVITVALAMLLSACAPTIKICKQTQPPGGTGFPFTAASGSAGVPLPAFSLNDAQCRKTTLAAGQDHYNTFTENVPAGWVLTNISCNAVTSPVKFIGANANPAFQPGDDTVTIDLNERKVTCTFVNRPGPCCSFSLDLSTGQGTTIDPSWTVNGGSAYITPPSSAWTANVPAQWIQPLASPTPAPNVPPGSYTYAISFNVPPCGTGHVELRGTVAADNDATVILDNTNVLVTCTNCFAAAVPFNVPALAAGSHVLQVIVNNQGGLSGAIVSAQVRQMCP